MEYKIIFMFLAIMLMSNLVLSFDPFDHVYWNSWKVCDLSTPNDTFSVGTGHWLVVSVVGIFLVGIATVAVYLLGTVTSLPQLKGWAKSEMNQILVSILILVVLIPIIPLLIEITTMNNLTCQPPECGAICGDATGGSCTMMQTAQMYSVTMRKTLMGVQMKFLWVNVAYQSLTGGKYTIEFSEILKVTSKIKPAMSGLSKLSGWIQNFIGPSILVWIASEWLLCFIDKMAFAVFLPLGLIFRTFPMTRSVGGGLIAFALVAFFVYPLMLNLDNVILSAYYGKDPIEVVNYHRLLTDNPDLIFSTPSPFDGTVSSSLDAISHNANNLFKLGITYNFIVGAVFCPGAMGMMFSIVYYYLIVSVLPNLVYLIFIATIVLNILNVFIVLNLFTDVAKFFGSDMNFASLTSLI